MWRNRKYKSGTTWCLWRWTDVDSEYITRLHLIKTPWFAICLHWLNKPDPEPYLHDHPVSFLSIILRGWYAEIRRRDRDYCGRIPCEACGVETRIIKHRWFNWVRATEFDRHTICQVAPKTLTLCIMGPKVREWGFHTPAGWIWWKSYYMKQRAEKGRTRK